MLLFIHQSHFGYIVFTTMVGAGNLVIMVSPTPKRHEPFSHGACHLVEEVAKNHKYMENYSSEKCYEREVHGCLVGLSGNVSLRK